MACCRFRRQCVLKEYVLSLACQFEPELISNPNTTIIMCDVVDPSDIIHHTEYVPVSLLSVFCCGLLS